MTMVGVVFGLVPLAVMPLQIWGGQLTDRIGRRLIIVFSVAMVGVLVRGLRVRDAASGRWRCWWPWRATFGWPLFQTAATP